MAQKERRLFCDINPTCYAISLKKEKIKRHIKDLLSKEKFAKQKSEELLPNVVSAHSSNLIKKGRGIDPVLQENKAVNTILACKKINKIVIRPGEVFSFWKTIGKTTKKKGYKDGRVIKGNKLIPGIGGGLCNLGNTIHWLVLHSPMEVKEFHSHSDALAPDVGGRKPFSAGTSVSYNHIDFRFKNTTDQAVQLCLWVENDRLCGELRSMEEYPWTYALIEEDHHFRKEGEKYYRISKVYRLVIEKESGAQIRKELILDNHSLVMYDHSLIPKEQIRDD